MLKIIDEKIYLRRGDDEILEVNLNAGEESVQMGEGETLTLTVREQPSPDSPIIFTTTSAPGSNRIVISHADTADVAYGEYSADVQLMTAEGHRKTVWPDIDANNLPKANDRNLKNFVLLPEVTMA